MRSLFFMILLLSTCCTQAAEPTILTCRPYGNAWFDVGKGDGERLEVSRDHGMLNGKALTISIDFKRHVVMNRWGDKNAIETIVHSEGSAYYIKGRQKAEYYGTYSFSADYGSAIYSSDGGFVSFLQCKPNKRFESDAVPFRYAPGHSAAQAQR